VNIKVTKERYWKVGRDLAHFWIIYSFKRKGGVPWGNSYTRG